MSGAIDVGMGKSARRVYGLDELSIVSSRRTRDVSDVDTSWQIDAFGFEIPVIASPMDSVSSPTTAIAMGKLGGLGVVHLEGLWTRHDEPEAVLDDLAELRDDQVHAALVQAYSAPVRPDLVRARIAELHAAGVTACGAVSPANAQSMLPDLLAAELDLLVIQGTIVSAEHVSQGETEPLNLKRFVRELEIPVIVGGCASYPAALHLMRTGAAGVLVGVGQGQASSTPDVLGVGGGHATAIADARSARMRHLDETGVYVHVIADGGMRTGGDIAKAIVCGADAVMIGTPLAAAEEAPGRGYNWGMAATHRTLPRGGRVGVGTRGTLAEVLFGPATDHSGSTNLIGALRKSMAVCGYASLKEFQKADVVLGAARGTPRGERA
ncbi:MAG TPA: GuaB3 family IMP dehydrogenase-related protein [Microthrixaceae bacterium]|nr:GuaB3 family IMP dehydrogenase-related protein [Microthrixaceae bacterium]